LYIYTKVKSISTNAPVLNKSTKEYRRRKPEYSPYYQCIEDYYEQFKRLYDGKFSQKYGYLRPHIEKVIYQYLDCGILHNGFARIKCRARGHEKLLAFSCRRRHFCPSCHAKRCVEFGEFLCTSILKKVPHRHFVFSMPKILRIYFLFNRNLLKELSRISWEVIGDYYWIDGEFMERNIGRDSDYYAVKTGYVSITPIHYDMTDYKTMDLFRSWDIERI
jgi:hypothetical protein